MKRSSLDALLESRLAELEGTGLLRQPPEAAGVDDVDLGSNDYLGLGRARGTTALGSRLLTGDAPAHTILEQALATWVGAETALAFTSGYAANVGLVSALAQPGDLVVSDILNHASIIDGCRLSRADVRVVAHCDVDAVAAALRSRSSRAAAFVVTESYFSMDADTPDLAHLAAVCANEGAALVVDEAHALGVFGPNGAGLCAEGGVRADALMGTFGKSLGVSGAFAAGSLLLRSWLWNRARSFVFSTGISPLVADVVASHVGHVRFADRERERLHALTAFFRSELSRMGIQPLGHGPIVPWVVGCSARAMGIAAQLRAKGVRVHAVRPPTVPDNAARIRFALHAGLRESDVQRALAAIAAL